MLARVFSCTCIGLAGTIVEVEVDSSSGNPKVIIVGLPDAAVEESGDRVRSAIKNAGFHYPRGRVTVNLAPATVRKEGPAFDLPIALGVLVATGEWRGALQARSFDLCELFKNTSNRDNR